MNRKAKAISSDICSLGRLLWMGGGRPLRSVPARTCTYQHQQILHWSYLVDGIVTLMVIRRTSSSDRSQASQIILMGSPLGWTVLRTSPTGQRKCPTSS